MKFSEKLKYLKKNEYSQEQLAELINVSAGYHEIEEFYSHSKLVTKKFMYSSKMKYSLA